MKSNPKVSLFNINNIEIIHEKRVNVARGTEVDIKWVKVDCTDFT